MKLIQIILLIFISSFSFVFSQGNWVQKANFGGGYRYCAVGFSIGDKGYIGTGANDGQIPQNDFWEYDKITNTWTQKANFAGSARIGAVGFSIGTKGYIGTGNDDTFWEYDPSTNIWTQKANFAGGYRSFAVGFSINNKGYIGTGMDSNNVKKNDFWEYDPTTDLWTQKTNFSGFARYGAVGFSIGNRGYIGTGQATDLRKDFWEYNPETNLWTAKANFGGTARYASTGFSVYDKGYLGTGLSINNTINSDIWEYNSSTNIWTQVASFGGQARANSVGFSIGSKGYIGTGGYILTVSNFFNDLWQYNPQLSAPILLAPANNSTGVSLTPAFSWGSVAGATSYNIQVSTQTSFSSTVINGISFTNSFIPTTPLLNATLYYWRVKSIDSNVSSSWSGIWNFTTMYNLVAPVLISPANNSTGVILLPIFSWGSVLGASYYKIEVSTFSTFSSLIYGDTTYSTSYNLPFSLDINTQYFWRIRAIIVGPVLGPWSVVWNFTTLCLLAPSLTSPANNSTGVSLTPTFNWGSVPAATTYNIQVSTNTNFSSTIVNAITSTNSYTASSLSYFTLYYWRVKAINPGCSGGSPWSNVWNFTTTLQAPNLISPANNSTGVTLTPTFNWGSVTGATSYNLQVSTQTNFSSTVINQTTSSTSYLPTTPLSTGTQYYWRVKASSSSSSGPWSDTWNFMTTTIVAPTLISPANNATGVSLTPTFSWGSVTGATSYNIQVSTQTSFSTTIINQTTSSTSYIPTSPLSNGTYYYWRVNASNSTITSPWSSAWNFFTLNLVAPTLISPTNNSTGVSLTPTFSWGTVTGATSYNIQVSTQTSFSTTIINQNTSSTSFTPTTSLSQNTIYYWRVNASNTSSTSSWSSIWNFTTLGLPMPTLVSPANNATGISLTPTFLWGTITGATSYNIQVSTLTNFSTTIINQTTGSNSFTPTTPLLYGTLYYWRVNASNGTITSPWSNTWNFTTLNLLAPTLSTPTNNATGVLLTPSFSWGSVTGATSYNIQVSTQTNFSSFIINQNTDSITYTPTTPLLIGTLYHWRVKATNSGASSPWSSTWHFTTLTLGVPILIAPPNNATGVTISPTFIWGSVSGATSYNIQVSTLSNFSSLTLNQTTNLTSLIPAIPFTTNTLYYWRVKAINGSSSGAWSEVWNFRTVHFIFSVPVLTAPANNSTGVPVYPLFTWNSVANATFYNIQVSTGTSFTSPVINVTTDSLSYFSTIQLLPNTIYYWRVNSSNALMTGQWSLVWNFTTITETSNILFNVKVLMQNFWNGTTHRVSAGIIELRQGVDFYSSTLVNRQHGLINSNGILTLTINNMQPGLYWLVVRHGSHLPVVSAERVNINSGVPLNYDFSTSQSQALNGTALIQQGNVWVVMNGDVDGNLNIDALDYSPTRNNFGWGSEASEPEPQP